MRSIILLELWCKSLFLEYEKKQLLYEQLWWNKYNNCEIGLRLDYYFRYNRSLLCV